MSAVHAALPLTPLPLKYHWCLPFMINYLWIKYERFLSETVQDIEWKRKGLTNKHANRINSSFYNKRYWNFLKVPCYNSVVLYV